MKTGIALLTLGGPRNLNEVPNFLKNFTGKELPEKVIFQISERYKLIGGGSPLPFITEKQALALQNLLPENYICRAAFRYCSPDIEETISHFLSEKVKKIVFFLLSPFYTSVTTGNYIEKTKSIFIEKNINVQYSFIHSWYKNEAFINCWINKINRELPDRKSFVIYTAHSIPERLSHEPYKNQINELCEEISERLNIKNWALGWQSIPSNSKEPWLGPEVEEVMENIKSQDYSSIIEIPIGFTADHIETLYDIDIIHKNYAEQIGLNFKRVSSLNDDPYFIKAIYDILLEQGEI